MFSVIKAVYKDLVSYVWPLTKRNNIIRVIALVAIVFALTRFFGADEVTLETSADTTPIVMIGTVSDIEASDQAAFVGTVRAVSEAQIQSEVGGRVTRVSVEPGDQVTAGTIIASLENASQQAAVLQAQGAYESALAAAAQSDVSVEDAQNSLTVAQNGAISTYRNTYNTVNGLVVNTLDQFYGNPTGAIVGLKVQVGNQQTLINLRKNLQTALPEWQISSQQLLPTGDVDTALTEAAQEVRDVLVIVDALLAEASEANNTDLVNGQPITSFRSALTSARDTLTASLTSLESAKTTLTTARENLRRAEIGGTNSSAVSAANASIKSALGGLRSAQANLAKTILRTPIAGTVNSVSINTGDFIGAFTQIAEVANNNALEISLFVGENDLANITLGGAVTINRTIPGTITNIAPAIDSTTGKTEVKIGTESVDLTNGDTVTVQLDTTATTTEAAVDVNAPLLVPIKAVKFAATDGTVFVVEDGTLVARPVTVGPINGTLVTITAGIDATTEFVLDARGLSAGAEVEAMRN